MTVENAKYVDVFNTQLIKLFWDALRVSFRHPGQALFFVKMVFNQYRARNVRKYHMKNGIHVPPFLIFSVTNRCNLKCKGCYSKAQRSIHSTELESSALVNVLDEAENLGIGISLVAGGEPLIRPDLLDILGNHKKMVFPVFTNGLLIDDAKLDKFKKFRNIIPVISIEGFERETDERRGSGVYETLKSQFINLKKQNLFWGISQTATSENFRLISSDERINELIKLGCRLFFFVEYVPVVENTESLILSDESRDYLINRCRELKEQFPGLFIMFPGDEEDYGGCLAAGRGFLHISASGDIEPCPFAPFTDRNIKNSSLRDALDSDFLKAIRENHQYLVEGEGGCALWSNREWVGSLLENNGKHQSS